MKTVLIFAAGGAISWMLRIACIALAPSGRFLDRVQRVLRYASPAALAALVAVSVSDGAAFGAATAEWQVLAATAATAAIAWRTRNMLLTLLAGSVSISVLTLL